MSVLAHVVLGGSLPAEPAATQALAHILKSNPDIAGSFVGLLQDANVAFEPGPIEAERAQEEDSRPDLTIHDSEGRVRIFVENKFWAGLTKAQPVSYLRDLPEYPPSALLFIVPEQRVATVWNELKARCSAEDLEWTDAPGVSAVTSAHVGCKTIMIASWSRVLERLLDAAGSGGHDNIRHDILQLRGLTSQMDAEAFLPLREDEATDQDVARRLINYVELIPDIIEQLKRSEIADTKGLRPGNTTHSAGRFFRIHAHQEFVSWLGIHLIAWQDAGISPLWWRFHQETGVVADHFKTIPELFEGVTSRPNGLYVPIRLRTGVERERVIADAVAQIERITDKVLKTIPNS